MKRKSELDLRSYTQHHTSAVQLPYANGTNAESRSERDFDLDDLVIVEGCDLAIAEGVRQIRQEIANSPGRCTLNSRQYSLGSLVKKFLDQPIWEFFKARCLDRNEFRISDALRNSATETHETIRSMIHERETDDVTYATLETLLYFSEFCEGREAIERMRVTHCKLCWRRTEFEEALWEQASVLDVHALVYRGYASDDSRRLNLKFCVEHDPGKRSAVYRSAFQRKDRFQEELQQVADWFVDRRLAPFPHELRKIAYLRAHPKAREKELTKIAQRIINRYASRIHLLDVLLGGCERLKKLLEERRNIVFVNANSDGRVFFRLVDGKKFQALPTSDVERNTVISNAANLVNARCDIKNPSINLDFPELGMIFTGTVAPMSPASAFSIRFELPHTYFQAIHVSKAASCKGLQSKLVVLAFEVFSGSN